MNRFVVSDPSRCIGCSACRVTCTESHRRRALRPASRISLVKTRTVSAAVTCHQCEGAPCMTVCPEGAIVQERDRLHVDESRCTGCLLCALVCPFGAVYPSAPSTAHVKAAPYSRASSARSAGLLRQKETGAYTSVVMCDLCAKSPNGPRCVEACPTKALALVDEGMLEALGRTRRIEAIARNAVARPGAPAAASTKALSLAAVVSGASREIAGPFSANAYVPHSSSPSCTSWATVISRAICRKQNSGVLTRNPCPASTKELAGRLVHLWLTRLAVVVLASVVPTIARTGSLHPAGRRFPCASRGFEGHDNAFVARRVAVLRS